MTRLLLVIASIALAFGAGVTAAASILVSATQVVPAQGSISVVGACVSSAGLAYTYTASDGTTAVTASSGDAAYVRSIVITRTAGTTSCVDTKAAIRFDNTTGTAPLLETGAENPTFVGDASSGNWTFLLDTTSGTGQTRNAISSWSTGDAITVTVYP